MTKLFAMRRMFDLLATLNAAASTTYDPQAWKLSVLNNARSLMEGSGYAPDTALALAMQWRMRGV